MTDRLEQLIREQFASDAEQAPTASALAEAAKRRAHRGQRLAANVLLAVAAVVVIAVGVAWLHSSRADVSAVGQPASTVLPAVPQQTISYHGMTIEVPASWMVDPSSCNRPSLRDSVVIGAGFGTVCGAVFGSPTPAADITAVYLHSDDLGGPEADTTVLANKDVVIDGVPALTGSSAGSGGRDVSVLSLPSIGVLIQVESPTNQIASQLFSTVRIAAIDPLGCDSKVSQFGPTGNPPPSVFAARVPISGVVCEYTPHVNSAAGSSLVGSKRLTISQLRDVSVASAGLPSRAASATDATSMPFVWYRLTYANGQHQIVAYSQYQGPAVLSDGHRLSIVREHPRTLFLPDVFSD